MKKYFTITLLLLITQFIIAQNLILIHFDTKIGEIQNYYIKNPDGIFKIDYSGKLTKVILGNFLTKDDIINAINDLTFNRISNKFTLGNITLYTYKLSEVLYPDDYSIISKQLMNYPISLNGTKIEYFDNYFDDNSVKGYIKKIGNTKINYFTSYFLPKQFIGKISNIGDVKIELMNEYFRPEIIGFVKSIHSIDIKYDYNFIHKELNGKVIQIGKLYISYYKEFNQQSHIGMFKKITGKDDRFLLLQ